MLRPVSYTHLDVYKRQRQHCVKSCKLPEKNVCCVFTEQRIKTSLNKYRYNKFCQLVSKGKHEVNLPSLPPTTEAAHQHILRVFHRVQLWYGNVLDSEKWEWQKLHGNSVVPVTILEPPAPGNFFKLVVCRCIKGCHSGCGCCLLYTSRCV